MVCYNAAWFLYEEIKSEIRDRVLRLTPSGIQLKLSRSDILWLICCRELYEKRKGKIMDRWTSLRERREHRKFIESMMGGQ